MNTNTLTSVAVLAGLPGMKSLYQPVKVDSKAIQDFMTFYHSLLGEQGAELIHAKFNRLGLVFAPICCAQIKNIYTSIKH